MLIRETAISIVHTISKKPKPGHPHLRWVNDGEDCGGVKHGRVAREQGAHEFAGHVRVSRLLAASTCPAAPGIAQSVAPIPSVVLTRGIDGLLGSDGGAL